MKTITIMLLLLTASSHLHSEEIRYIRDWLSVPLRSGQTNQHRIVHKGLVSGTAVTLIEASEDKKYSLIRTGRNIEGWVQSQYLSPEPSARAQLKTANQALTALQKKNVELSQQFSKLKADNNKTQGDLSSIDAKSQQLSQELERIKAISANAIQLNTDNQRLLEENQMLKNKAGVLSTDNQRLNDEMKSDNFMNGAFAVILGVMVTLLVPRLWPKKGTDWA